MIQLKLIHCIGTFVQVLCPDTKGPGSIRVPQEIINNIVYFIYMGFDTVSFI